MVEQIDSFFSLRGDLASPLHKRPSPDQGSSRPPKRRTVDHESAACSSHHISDDRKTWNDTALSNFDTLAIRDRNMDAPSTSTKHTSRGSFSFPRRASKDLRNGSIGRRLSEAQDNLKAATSKAKDWCSNAFNNPPKPEQKSSSAPTPQSITRSRTSSISWGSRRISRPTIQTDTSQGPVAPQRTSSLEQSSFGPPLGRAPSQHFAPASNNGCANHPAHYGSSAWEEDNARRRSGHFPALRGSGDVEYDPFRQDRSLRPSNGESGQRRGVGFKTLRRSESDTESGIDMDGGPSRPTSKMHSRLGTPRGPRIDPATLPPEVMLNVFKHLSMSSLATSHLVSRGWNELASDFSVQKHKFISAWQPPTLQSPLPAPVGGRGLGKSKATCSDSMQDWKTMYRARQQLEHNWRRGKEKTTYLFSHTDSVYCVQFDEHKAITGSRDQTIRVWDLHTLKCIKVIGCARDAWLKDRQKSPVGGELTTEMDDQIRRTGFGNYYPTDDVYHQPRYWHEASILCLQYDDDVLVTGSSDHTLIIWEMHTFQPIRRLQRHTSGVLDLAFDNDKIVSCSKDYSICIWDRRTGEMLHQIHDHQGPVNAIQLRNDTIVSASGEGSAHLYKLNYKRKPGRRPGDPEIASCKPMLWKTFWSKDRGLACIEYSDDGRYVFAGGNDHLIFKYDTTAEATTAPIQQSWRGHDGLVRSLYLDPSNGRTISGSYDLSIRVWDYKTGKCMRHYQEKTTSWILSAKSDYRRLVATSQDGKVVVLDFGGDVEGVECLQGTDKPEVLVPKTQVMEKVNPLVRLGARVFPHAGP